MIPNFSYTTIAQVSQSCQAPPASLLTSQEARQAQPGTSPPPTPLSALVSVLILRLLAFLAFYNITDLGAY